MNIRSFVTARPYLVAVLAIVLLAHIGSYGYVAHLASNNREAAQYPLLKGDSETYATLANSLLMRHTFERNQGEPERHWAPGYSFFLAIVGKIAMGNQHASFVLVVLIQIALALVAVALIYAMTRRFLNSVWSALPALLFGVDPNVVLANTTILSDGLFASLLVIVIYVALFYETRRSFLRWGMVGLTLGLLTLIRPIAQFLVPMIAFAIIAAEFKHFRFNFKQYALPVAMYVVVAIFVLAPWLYWYHHKFGSYEIAHVGASNLLYYNARDFLAWKEMDTDRSVPAILASRYREDPAYKKVSSEIWIELNEMTPKGEDIQNYEGKLAAQLIMQDPLRYAYFHAVNTVPYFLGSSVAAYEQVVVQVRDNKGYFAPTALVLIDALKQLGAGDWREATRAIKVVAPLGLEMGFWTLMVFFALVATWRGRRDYRVVLFALLIAYFAALTGPVSIARYRIPSEPYLLILAALGAHATLSYIYERRHRHLT
ncbi:glycosyltransferase family 39 protein [Candidatus Kaiserbacteria bacterium]|nr:glycosyltransferase family 39 protein [Candidatus Kaiserbacteria bacterium]